MFPIHIIELDLKIISYLDRTLNNIKNVNCYFNKLYNHNELWKLKINNQFNNMIIPKEFIKREKELYLKFYQLSHLQDIVNWSTENNYYTIVEFLINKGNCPSNYALDVAAARGHVEVLNNVAKYLQKISSYNPIILKFVSKDRFVTDYGLTLAKLNQNHDVLNLLSNFVIPQIKPYYNMYSVINNSIDKNHIDITEMCLKAGFTYDNAYNISLLVFNKKTELLKLLNLYHIRPNIHNIKTTLFSNFHYLPVEDLKQLRELKKHKNDKTIVLNKHREIVKNHLTTMKKWMDDNGIFYN